MMLSLLQKKVIASIQEDLPLVERPYHQLAKKIGVTEAEFLAVMEQLSAKGVIRRFGATLRHQKSGFNANAMAAWQVPEDKIRAVGQEMAQSPAISHCYRRDPKPSWPYNLYTMIHATSEEMCRETAQALSEKTGVKTYQLLFSRRELKKTSMVYFPDLP